MDAITLLKKDHQAVEELFRKFERAGDNAKKTKEKLVERMIQDLAMHAAIEEMAFYPFVKGVNRSLSGSVLESLEEHHVVKWVLSELDGMHADAERFDAKVRILIENVRHHVREEEKEMFPRVRTLLSREQLVELGDLLQRAKQVAPTHPHPKAPDEPPANVVTGLVSGFVDRVRRATSDATERVGAEGRKAVSRRTSRARKSTARKSSSARKSAARKSTARR